MATNTSTIGPRRSRPVVTETLPLVSGRGRALLGRQPTVDVDCHQALCSSAVHRGAPGLRHAVEHPSCGAARQRVGRPPARATALLPCRLSAATITCAAPSALVDTFAAGKPPRRGLARQKARCRRLAPRDVERLGSRWWRCATAAERGSRA
jgi:hypothetical protein